MVELCRALVSAIELMDGLLRVVDRMASFADFSEEGVLAPTAPMACSKGFPWDLGVLADPNDANAPEPSPNWFAPPALVGDVRLPPGVVALKGFERPWEEVVPLRLRARPEKSRGVVELSDWLVVESERLAMQKGNG